MSYAGPASRGKRAPQLESTVPSGRRNLNLAPSSPYPRWPSRTARRDRTVAFGAGVAVGLAVGAGVALLLAPQTGEDTRHAIADRGRRLAHRSRDVWDDLRDELQDAMDRRRDAWSRRAESNDDRCEEA